MPITRSPISDHGMLPNVCVRLEYVHAAAARHAVTVPKPIVPAVTSLSGRRVRPPAPVAVSVRSPLACPCFP